LETDDWVTNDVQSVFTMFLGSYFGDWDSQNNFLRAALGSSSYTLTSVWAGRPHWFFHHMGLGEPIAHSTLLSQNNGNGGLYSAANTGSREVHVALLGDPTLRMHPVLPVSQFTATHSSSGVSLAWSASPDAGVVGYHVYRASSTAGPFTRLTPENPVTATSLSDTVSLGTHTYMVRAVKLQRSAGGTYFNASQGIFVTATASPAPAAPSRLQAEPQGALGVELTWMNHATNALAVEIERSLDSGSFIPLASLPAGTSEYVDGSASLAGFYAYRVRAVGAFGLSLYSEAATATVEQAVWDSDDDGLPDEWELLYGFNPRDGNDASIDSDQDGLTNLEEFIAGTDPTDSSSVLRFSVCEVANGNVEVKFDSAAHKTYGIEFSPTFKGPWSTLVDQVTGTGETIVISDPDARGATSRFYRIVVGPE
jgi:hypothetical protein